MNTDALHIACAHCGATNRVPAARLAEDPTCGRCGQALLAGEPVVLPGSLQESCDGLDQDCDGQTDEGYPDENADGAADCAYLSDDPDDDGVGVRLRILGDEGDVGAAENDFDAALTKFGSEFVGAHRGAGDDGESDEIGLQVGGHVGNSFVD